MIKRLFRMWLRFELVKKIGEATNYEQVFDWIYNSPIKEWYFKIHIARWSEHLIDSSDFRKGETVDLDKANNYLDFLHK